MFVLSSPLSLSTLILFPNQLSIFLSSSCIPIILLKCKYRQIQIFFFYFPFLHKSFTLSPFFSINIPVILLVISFYSQNTSDTKCVGVFLTLKNLTLITLSQCTLHQLRAQLCKTAPNFRCRVTWNTFLFHLATNREFYDVLLKFNNLLLWFIEPRETLHLLLLVY